LSTCCTSAFSFGFISELRLKISLKNHYRKIHHLCKPSVANPALGSQRCKFTYNASAENPTLKVTLEMLTQTAVTIYFQWTGKSWSCKAKHLVNNSILQSITYRYRSEPAERKKHICDKALDEWLMLRGTWECQVWVVFRNEFSGLPWSITINFC
jgi:hypothetical protein